MNMLKKGPELKLPDFKVPDFALDIYYDLRERHLLPLVAILLVALVALPIVLSGGSSSDASGESESAAMATPSTVQTSASSSWPKRPPACANTSIDLPAVMLRIPSSSSTRAPKAAQAAPARVKSPQKAAKNPRHTAESTEPSGATETTPPHGRQRRTA